MTAYGTAPRTVRRAWPAMPGELPISVGLASPLVPRTGDVVSSLRASPTYALAVQVYRVHQRDGAGRCRACGSRQCRSWGHGAAIIAAAGVKRADVDTARCDVRLRRHQRAFPVRGDPPQGVKIARALSRRPCGQSHCRATAATRNLRTSAETAALAKARRPGLARSIDQYPLHGRLFCRCGQRFIPTCSSVSGREYMCLYGCRLWPIDAAAIEQRVYAHITCSLTASGSGRSLRAVTGRPQPFDMHIEVGGTVDDVWFVRRT
jgi:hypothetical protein